MLKTLLISLGETMSAKRAFFLCLTSAIALTSLSCRDQDSLLSPVNPQYAKPVKPPPPEPPAAQLELEEFWVVPGEVTFGEDGSLVQEDDILHVVWSGAGFSVNPTVVWDHFFDGIRDDDPPADDHYEYETPGPPGADGEELGNGLFHADIPWNGIRREGFWYPDYPTTEVPGEGDPFAFRLTFYDETGARVGAATPFGVVVGGFNVFGEIKADEVTVESVVEGETPDGQVRSFATYKGDVPAGSFSIAELSMTPPSCKIRTVRTDVGRSVQASISTEVTLTFETDPAIALADKEYIWWEGHILDEDTGEISPRGHLYGSRTFSVSQTMPIGWTEGSLSFVIDYVVSSGSTTSSDLARLISAHYVYDPGRNAEGVRTTAGFSSELWDSKYPSSKVNDGRFPVAHTKVFQVSCR